MSDNCDLATALTTAGNRIAAYSKELSDALDTLAKPPPMASIAGNDSAGQVFKSKWKKSDQACMTLLADIAKAYAEANQKMLADGRLIRTTDEACTIRHRRVR